MDSHDLLPQFGIGLHEGCCKDCIDWPACPGIPDKRSCQGCEDLNDEQIEIEYWLCIDVIDRFDTRVISGRDEE